MNKKVLSIVLIVILLIGSGYALWANADKEEETTGELKISHKLGEIAVKRNPENVVVFDYGMLDALDYLGVEVAGMPKGLIPKYLDKYNDAQYAALGDLKEPNFEAIQKLKPELIIISGRQEALYDQFSKIAPTLYVEVDGMDYFGSVRKNVTTLGQIFDKEQEAEQALKEIEAKAKSIRTRVEAEKRVALVTMVGEGSMSAYGAGSRFGVVYNALGYTPVDERIDDATHGQQISYEFIVKSNPQHLFVV
ncbi:MAG: siderophore ABC transporter substrate-binding protein, partial [Bacilli bacterium]